jgi:hypothetical protein
MSPCTSPVFAAIDIQLERNKNFVARSWPRGCAVDHMVWLNCSETKHLGMVFLLKKLLTSQVSP